MARPDFLSPKQNDATSSPREDEITPLISRSFDNRGSPRGRSFFRNSLPLSFERPSFLRTRSSSSSSTTSGPDIDTLQLDLARINSHPSGLGLEPGRPEWVQGRVCRRQSKADARNVAVTEVLQGDVVEATDPELDGEFEDESKFIGVSPSQFWLMFSTIMFGYFVSSHFRPSKYVQCTETAFRSPALIPL
jgi:hypothetical protein